MSTSSSSLFAPIVVAVGDEVSMRESRVGAVVGRAGRDNYQSKKKDIISHGIQSIKE